MKRYLMIGLALLALSFPPLAFGQEDSPRPWIGVRLDENSLTVAEVLADSPAEAAGLQVGDQITALNDTPLATYEELLAALSEFAPGEEVTLGILRGEEAQDVSLTLGERPADVQIEVLPGQNMPGMPGMGMGGDMMNRAALGVSFYPVDESFAANLGLSVNAGALILEVMPDSAAEAAGLQAGDIITAVDGIPLDEERGLPDLINDYEVGDTVTLSVLRAGASSEVQATLQADFMGRGDGFHGGRGQGGPFGQGMPFGEGMPFVEIIPFGQGGPFGQGMPFDGDILRQFEGELPSNGEPFSITCTDDEGNTVFSFSFQGMGQGRGQGRGEGMPFRFEGGPGGNVFGGGGLNLDELNCEVQVGEPEAPSGDGA